MLDNFEVVNPTEVLWGEAMPARHDPHWNRVVWSGSYEPSTDDVKSLAEEISQYSGFSGNAHGGWMETNPSDTLMVRQQRGIKVGKVSLPLGWKTQYEDTVTKILAA